MKKRLFMIILSALALAGCAKEMDFEDCGNSLFASIDNGEAVTKAALIDNPGIRLDSKWQDGEAIGVFGTSASNVSFSISASDISEDGKTAKFSSATNVPGGALTAYSPYQAGVTGSAEAMTIDFPSVQKYTYVNGVPQPDPQSNIMVATGSANAGLTFRNAVAVLKIGRVFENKTVVKSVEFRDLSGAPVCGSMSLSWNGGSPKATVTGTGTVITLDCGEGLSFAAGQKGIFFIVVPAREYSKGISLTFVDSAGEKTVKTAGATKGKTFERSVVYTIGDISSREPLPGSVSTLKPQAQIMTAEKMDKVQILNAKTNYVYWEDGSRVQTPNGMDLRMPNLDMIVPADLNPAVGNWLIFDEPSDILPGGGVFRIKTCNKQNDDFYEIVAVPEVNVAAPFEDLKVGEPLVDANGELVENGGVSVNITDYITSIVDGNGKPVQFSVSPSGKILLSEETVADIYGVKRNWLKNDRFSSPKVSLNTKSDNLEISVGGTLSLETKMAVRYMQGEFQYMQLTVTPELEASLGAVLKAEGNIESSARIFTINVLPFPIAPGVLITPQIILNAKVGVGGNLQVSGTFTATQKLGTYSLAYNKGDGATLRWLRPAISNPTEFGFDFGGVEGSLYAYGGIGVRTNISLYAMCGLGLDNELTFKFGTFANSDSSLKLALTPEFEVTPSFTCLLGSKKFTDLTGKIEFDPMWERYIRPKPRCSIITRYNYSDRIMIDIDDEATIDTPVPTGVRGFEYLIKLEGKCAEDMKLALLVYQGKDIKYTPDSSDDPLGIHFQHYKDAGVEHLYFSANKSLVEPGEKPIQTIEIGTYPAETESMTFDSFVACSGFASGQAYGVVPAIIQGENQYIISRGGFDNYFNPFIYWWPYKSNGQLYYEGQEL